MDTRPFESMTTQQQYDARTALHAAAKARAGQLRRQAISDLLSAIGQGLRAGWRTAGYALRTSSSWGDGQAAAPHASASRAAVR